VPLPITVKRILGEAGTTVKLKIVHTDGVTEDVSVQRAALKLATVQGFRRDEQDRWRLMLDDKHKVGYVRILQFSQPTAAEVRAAIESLKKDGMKGLILDLRSCPGGLLDQAIKVAGFFLPQGKILETRGPNKKERVFQADGKDYLGDFPMVVLLNEQTASSGEIVAGALRDHSRAILVGSRSYGKGSVQMILKLAEGGALKMTTAYHYLPSGRNIQKRPGAKTWGVDPTDGYYLPLTKEQTEALQKDAVRRSLLGLKKDERPRLGEPLTPRVIAEDHADPQLGAALRTMVARLTGGEFVKVGKSNALLLEHAQKLEELRQRRETLEQNLRELDRQIADTQRAAPKGEKTPRE
jgi:carboxyl-terminal processing protease